MLLFREHLVNSKILEEGLTNLLHKGPENNHFQLVRTCDVCCDGYSPKAAMGFLLRTHSREDAVSSSG